MGAEHVDQVCCYGAKQSCFVSVLYTKVAAEGPEAEAFGIAREAAAPATPVLDQKAHHVCVL